MQSLSKKCHAALIAGAGRDHLSFLRGDADENLIMVTEILPELLLCVFRASASVV